MAKRFPAASSARRSGRRNMPAASSPAARCSRNWASITSARSTATTSTICCRCCATCATPTSGGPILLHVDHPEGQGLRAGRGVADKLHARQPSSTSSPASRPRRRPGPPSYTKVFADALIAEAERRSRHRGDHRGDAVRHRAGPIRQAVPRPLLRCRHRRAARGDLRRRAGDRGHEAVLRHLLAPSCSAPTTRWCTTWRCRRCRCASPSTAPAWSAPTGRPMPAASTSPILGCLPGMVVMAPADEAELVHMVATAAAIDDRPERAALSARRGHGAGAAGARRGAADRPRPRPARGQQGGASCRSGTRLAMRCAPPTNWPRAACRRRWRMPASPSRWTPR